MKYTRARVSYVKKGRFPILVTNLPSEALYPELIPVYRQSARRWREVNHAIDPALDCRYSLSSFLGR